MQQFISYPTFLLLKFIDVLFEAFIGTVQVIFTNTFADTLFPAFIILSHIITELSIVLAKYLPFSQLHVA